MTQPLEQFIPSYYSYFDLYLFTIDCLFFNKYLMAVLVVCVLGVSTLLFINLLKNLSFAIKFQFYYNRIMVEMVNVVSFNFMFFTLLYFSVFLYIYVFNTIGLLPHTPCLTTQIFGNLFLSFTLIVGITLMNLDKNGVLFFQLFVPKGVPAFLIPFLFCLEFFSYFIRILSLSIRLFSNMVAGHSLLHILFDMVVNVRALLETKLDLFLALFGFLIAVIVVIVVFEVIVAFLQAYVFAIMFSIYLNDLNLSH